MTILTSWAAAFGIRLDSRDARVLHACQHAYRQPWRHYHNLQHIQQSVSLLYHYRHLTAHAETCFWAIMFHDIVYQPGHSDNEVRSARVAEEQLRHRRDTDHHLIAALIRSTAAGADLRLPDMRLLHDIDHAILGSRPAFYRCYARAIRAELADIDDGPFRRGRRAFLQRQLDRSRVFAHPAMRGRFEDAARRNMRWEWRALGAP